MRSLTNTPSLAGLLLAVAGVSSSFAAETQRQPVIVELFTSEGCSSCPPADAVLRKLDASQPVPGAQVIVLGEHVDYWDRLGWKDPASSPVYTRRQEDYARRFRLNGAYTPQVVIDGVTEALGSDFGRIQDVVRHVSRDRKVPVQISEVFSDPRGTAAVHIEVIADGKASAHRPHLMVALADDSATTDVPRGENSGRRLTHVAVVRVLTDAGSTQADGTFSADIPLTGQLAQWQGKRLVAFLQDEAQGPIRGAALRNLPTSVVR